MANFARLEELRSLLPSKELQAKHQSGEDLARNAQADTLIDYLPDEVFDGIGSHDNQVPPDPLELRSFGAQTDFTFLSATGRDVEARQSLVELLAKPQCEHLVVRLCDIGTHGFSQRFLREIVSEITCTTSTKDEPRLVSLARELNFLTTQGYSNFDLVYLRQMLVTAGMLALGMKHGAVASCTRDTARGVQFEGLKISKNFVTQGCEQSSVSGVLATAELGAQVQVIAGARDVPVIPSLAYQFSLARGWGVVIGRSANVPLQAYCIKLVRPNGEGSSFARELSCLKVVTTPTSEKSLYLLENPLQSTSPAETYQILMSIALWTENNRHVSLLLTSNNTRLCDTVSRYFTHPPSVVQLCGSQGDFGLTPGFSTAVAEHERSLLSKIAGAAPREAGESKVRTVAPWYHPLIELSPNISSEALRANSAIEFFSAPTDEGLNPHRVNETAPMKELLQRCLGAPGREERSAQFRQWGEMGVAELLPELRELLISFQMERHLYRSEEDVMWGPLSEYPEALIESFECYGAIGEPFMANVQFMVDFVTMFSPLLQDSAKLGEPIARLNAAATAFHAKLRSYALSEIINEDLLDDEMAGKIREYLGVSSLSECTFEKVYNWYRDHPNDEPLEMINLCRFIHQSLIDPSFTDNLVEGELGDHGTDEDEDSDDQEIEDGDEFMSLSMGDIRREYDTEIEQLLNAYRAALSEVRDSISLFENRDRGLGLEEIESEVKEDVEQWNDLIDSSDRQVALQRLMKNFPEHFPDREDYIRAAYLVASTDAFDRLREGVESLGFEPLMTEVARTLDSADLERIRTSRKDLIKGLVRSSSGNSVDLTEYTRGGDAACLWASAVVRRMIAIAKVCELKQANPNKFCDPVISTSSELAVAGMWSVANPTLTQPMKLSIGFEEPLTIIRGVHGSGKSELCEALVWGMAYYDTTGEFPARTAQFQVFDGGVVYGKRAPSTAGERVVVGLISREFNVEHPQLRIFDEPFSQLSTAAQEEGLRALVQKTAEAPGVSIVVTHHHDVIEALKAEGVPIAEQHMNFKMKGDGELSCSRTLEPGAAPSMAKEIARALGLPADIVDRAARLG